MSILGEEIRTVTSEDFGFKKLGQATILPSYNEQLPFASLQNLDISNSKSLYVASSGGKVVIGKLQVLRDFIQNDSSSEISFLWERSLADVIMVKILSNDRAVIVAKNGTVFSVDLTSLGELQEVHTFSKPLLQVYVFLQNSLLALDLDGELLSYSFAASSSSSLLSGVASFDAYRNQIFILLKDFSVQNYSLTEHNKSMNLVSQFSIPSDLNEDLQDQYIPLSINSLNKKQFLMVFGESISETVEDVMYDHKIFIVTHSSNEVIFQESFDITPAFGSVLRYPTCYNSSLPDLIPNQPQVNILTSACSSEVTIWDSNEVIQPSQDSERAVLPISKTTDNDTNPVGMSLDVTTNGVVANPCPGVDSVEKLPLIYILNNEGDLQIVGLYHSSAIKNQHYTLKELKERIMKDTSMETPVIQVEAGTQVNKEIGSQFKVATEVGSEAKIVSPPKETPEPQFSGLTLTSDADEEKTKVKLPFAGLSKGLDRSTEKITPVPSVSFGQTGFGSSGSGSAAAFGQPDFGTSSSTFGQTGFGTSSSTFGQTGFGNSSSTFGQIGFGNLGNNAAFGKPSFGSSGTSGSFGQPSFGNSGQTSAFQNPSFKSLSSGDSNSPELAFGKPAFGQSAIKNPFINSTGNKNGESPFAALSSSTSEHAKEGSQLPEFGQTGLGATGFNFSSEDKPKPSSASGSDKPAFGIPSFAKNNAGASDKAIFGQSSFGSSLGQNSPFNSNNNMKPSHSVSPFGNSAFGFAEPSKESPFAALLKKSSDSTGEKISDAPESAYIKKEEFSDESEEVDSRDELSSGKEHDNHQLETAENDEQDEMMENDQNTESEDENASDNENLVLERTSEEETESQVPSNNEDTVNSDLSDSTVEQTPSNQSSRTALAHPEPAGKPSLSSFAARIKQGANVFTNDLKFPALEGQSSNSHKSQSPFSEFANELNKAPSQGFSFAKFSSDDKDTGKLVDLPSTKVNSSDENIPNLSRKHTSNEDFEVSPLSSSEEANSKDVTNSSELIKKRDEEDMEDEQAEKTSSVDFTNRSPLLESSTDNQPVSTDQKNDQLASRTDLDTKTSIRPSEPPTLPDVKVTKENQLETSDSSVSHSEEESYDALDDITQGELEEVMDSDHQPAAEEKTKTSFADRAVNIANANVNNAEVQASPPLLVSKGIQAAGEEGIDIACQTEPIATCNFEVQSFEKEESYLATECKPQPLRQYFTGAEISQIQYTSDDATMRSIERTYHLVSAELSVLLENISNLKEFTIDQSTEYLEKRTKKSVPNIYTWRIPESQKLQEIITDQTRALPGKLLELKNKDKELLKLSSDDIGSSQKEVVRIKEEYQQFEMLKSNSYLIGLKYHQSNMQSELRKKMFKVSETVNHIEELLQILKIYTIKNKKLKGNPFVDKLAREFADRDNLVNEIVCLREEIQNLSIRSQSEPSSEDNKYQFSILQGDIQSAAVVEVGLLLNTRRQFGDIFKKSKVLDL